MNTELLSVDAILAKYPEQKPVCLNYAGIRGELIALASENLRLARRLASFEEELNSSADCQYGI